MISVGSDPELMLRRNGKLVSALGILSGRKHAPRFLRSGGSVLADNVNLELNHPPANTAEGLSGNLRAALVEIHGMLPNIELVARASAVFPMEEMEDYEAHVFGCEPEFNAWDNGEIVIPPRLEPTNFFRSCGGHVHVGWEPAVENPLRLIQAMDLFVGVPLVLMDTDETSPARRILYGGAGKFRPTRYGAEWRTPGNFWVRHPQLAEIVFMLTEIAVAEVETPASMDARHAVQEHDLHLASQVFDGLVAPRLPRFLVNDITDMTKKHISENVLENWGI